MKNLFSSIPSRTRLAFTLAEVLITLGIIGVVAALTIPALITNYQKTQYLSQLKKSYTQMTEALKQVSIEHGCTNDLKCTGLFEDTTGGDAGQACKIIGDEVVKHFKIIKNCELDPGCESESMASNYDGSDARYDGTSGNYTFITADGASFMVSSYLDNCADSGWSSGKLGYTTQMCGAMIVDVNGPNKGPNNMGRDIFQFYITNGKGIFVYPGGGEDIDDNMITQWKDSSGNPVMCDSNVSNKDGQSCAGRIMDEGWQMNY